jgi:hypothetical protein
MAAKKGSMAGIEPEVKPERNKAGMKQGDILSIMKEVSAEIPAEPEKKKQKSTGGRPRLNPHAQDKKLTIWIPEDLHRQLRITSAEQGKPMTEISVDALIKHLEAYKGK